MAVGALVVLAEAKARCGAVIVPGRIIGFSRQQGDSGDSFHVVAQYQGPDGSGCLIESAVGSSTPMGRVGDALSILIRPEDPETALVKSPATYLIGIVLAGLGTVSCWVFLITFRPEPFSVLASIGVVLFFAYKAHGFLMDQPASLRDWMALKDKAIRGRVLPAEAKDQISWADAATLASVDRRQRKVSWFAFPILVLVGAGLLFLALHLHRTTRSFLATAVPAPGRVVELVANDSSDSVTYAPLVEFEAGGQAQRFKDSISSDPPSYRTGDVVQVLYDPANPRKARIDRGIWNRAIPLLVGSLGGFLLISGLWIPLRPQRSVPTPPQT